MAVTVLMFTEVVSEGIAGEHERGRGFYTFFHLEGGGRESEEARICHGYPGYNTMLHLPGSGNGRAMMYPQYGREFRMGKWYREIPLFNVR